MKLEIILPGTYCLAKVTLEKDEQFNMTPDAMVAMDAVMDVDGKIFGDGIGSMIKRAITGSSARIQTVTAKRGRGEILLAPDQAGDICLKALKRGEELILNHGAYLGSAPEVEFDMKLQGPIKTLLGGGTFTLQKMKGPGFLLFSSFGSILHKTLGPGEKYVVDNDHLLGWTGTVKYSVKKSSGSMLSSWLSEGFVYQLEGPGDIYIQSRGPASLANVLVPYFVTKKNDELKD